MLIMPKYIKMLVQDARLVFLTKIKRFKIVYCSCKTIFSNHRGP